MKHKFSNTQEDLCENTQMILVSCALVGNHQRIIDRSNCKITFDIHDFDMSTARNAKNLATEIHAQALCTGQRNPQKSLELSLLNRQKLLQLIKSCTLTQ